MRIPHEILSFRFFLFCYHVLIENRAVMVRQIGDHGQSHDKANNLKARKEAKVEKFRDKNKISLFKCRLPNLN